jgi:hypothetical protein
MSTAQMIVLAALELIALAVIVRIWVTRRHKYVITRVIWSLVLMVPLLGVLFYFFLREQPDEHPYDTDTMSGTAGSVGDASIHH